MGKIGGIMKKPELLAPAGTFEKAKVAFMYGADAKIRRHFGDCRGGN